MANLSGSNFTSKFSNVTMDSETRLDLSMHFKFIITIVINSITCPFTVMLNVLVIMAVKRRPRLQTNTNILLSCLAVTDALTGLTTQPSFILWITSQFLGMARQTDSLKDFHGICLRVISICSLLHLMLLTCERLIAIRVTMHYHYIVTTRNIKVAVISCWLFSISYVACGLIVRNKVFRSILNLLAAFIVISSVLFIASAYVILYRETRRHRKMIKTQQLPQEEVQRFAEESKALKTTVLVVGSVILCFIPIAFTVLLFMFFKFDVHMGVTANACPPCPWVNTFVMLNSFLNPLIYCWRQKEMRQFVFRLSSPAVAPSQN